MTEPHIPGTPNAANDTHDGPVDTGPPQRPARPPVPAEVYQTRRAGTAAAAFATLTADERTSLLCGVFSILEYDENGQPGNEWSSDTTQALGDLFNDFGIVFTNPRHL